MSVSLKVILAEDNRLQRIVLAKMLTQLGYDVVEAADGQEALDLVLAGAAQIVLSDFNMPRLNGIELTRAIRTADFEQYIHVIMITGSDEDDVRNEAFDAGVDDFITKGQSPLLLKTRMRSAARLVQHARAVEEANRALKETHARLSEDLQSAATAQRQLLPDIQGKLLDCSVSSEFVPSSIVSGDMFGCFEVSDTQIGFYAVDVSGHGVHASLLSVAIGHLITPEYFRERVFDAGGAPDPATLIGELNDRFSASENDDYFTMFCGVIDCEGGALHYCQAAYPSPQLITPDGGVTPVGDGGFPVGMLPDMTYENGVLPFAKGDALLVFSDAVIEAEDKNDRFFGMERLRDIARTTPQIGVAALPSTVARALKEWRDGQPLEDDLTIVALERS